MQGCGPVVGKSWEGFVIESLLSVAPERTQSFFYATAAGAEVDLVLDFGGTNGLWAIEIKRGLTAKPERGFYHSLKDLQPQKAFVVHAGSERYPLGTGIEAIGLRELAEIVAAL